jgi:hypothetical protein
MRRVLPLLLGLAACDDGGTREITVHSGASLLVAVDPAGDGRWQRVDAFSDTRFEVGPRWLAADICGSPSSVWIAVRAYTAADGDDVKLSCWLPSLPTATIPFTVNGTDDLVDVSVGPNGGGWVDRGVGEGELHAYVGTWDLFASEDFGTRAILQHDVVVDDSTTIALDFDTDSFELQPRTYTAHGALANVAAATTVTLSSQTFQQLRPDLFADAPLLAVPPDRLGADDVQVAAIAAWDNAGNWQHANVPITDDPIEADLPAPLEGGHVERTGRRWRASWTDPGPWDAATIWATAPGIEWWFQDPETPDVGEITFPDIESIAGMQPGWRLSTHTDVTTYLSLGKTVDGGSISVDWSPNWSQPPPDAVTWR